jgi:hypothetical protein
MEDFDLEAACLVRLRQELERLLADAEPASRERIIALFSTRPRDGLEAIPLLRAALGPRLRRWPWPSPARGNATKPTSTDELEIDSLPEQPRATLWPYRPKREPDELLSSWLWRIARGLGAPPKRFALDAIGSHLADVDREIGDAAIDRLAFLSGQSREHLLRGTMRPDVVAGPHDQRGRVQQRLLRHGDLVLNRKRGGRGRAVPMIQYCPVCLGEDGAYLRRGWRFSIEVACFEDGCFLLDACWKCGALVDPLSQSLPAVEFACVKCGAPLAKAPSLHLPGTVRDQEAIYALLDRLGRYATDGFSPHEDAYVETLSMSDLRGTNPTDAAARHHAIMMAAAVLFGAPAVPPVALARAGKFRRRAKAGAGTAKVTKRRSQATSEIRAPEGDPTPSLPPME